MSIKLNNGTTWATDESAGGGGADLSGTVDFEAEPTIEGIAEFRRIYGKEMKGFRPQLAFRENAPTNIYFIGDSMTEGYGQTTYAKRWLDIVRANLQNPYRLGGEGYIPARQGLAQTWPSRWTYAGVWTDYEWGLGRRSRFAAGNLTDTATITAFCDRFYIHYTQGSTSTFKVVVDGVTLGTQNTNDSQTLSGRIWDSGTITRGLHTIVVSPNAGTSPFILDGATFFDGDHDKGVHIWDGSRSSYMAKNFQGDSGEDTTTVNNPMPPGVGVGQRRYWADIMFQPHTFTAVSSVTANGTTTLTYGANHTLDAFDIGEVVFASTSVSNVFPKNVRIVSIPNSTQIVVDQPITTGTHGIRTTRSRVNGTMSTTSGSPTVTGAMAFSQWDTGKTVKGTNIPANTYIKTVNSTTSITLSNNATGTTAAGTVQIINRRKYRTTPDLFIIEFGFNEQSTNETKANYKAAIQAVYQTGIDGAYCDSPTMTGIVNDERPSVCLLGLWAHGFKGSSVVYLTSTNGSAVVNDLSGFTNRFTTTDQGKSITTVGNTPIPAGTTIQTVTVPDGSYYATSITLSQSANATNGVFGATIADRQYTDAQWQDFRLAMRELCEDNDWVFFDLYSLAQWIGTYDAMNLTSDGMHPNDRGAKWIADELTIRLSGAHTYGAIAHGEANNAGEMLVAEAADRFRVKPGIRRKITADTASGAVAGVMVDITEWAFSIAPNETLSFLFNLFWTAAATTSGILFDLNPAANVSAPADLIMATIGPNGTTGATTSMQWYGRQDAAWGTDLTIPSSITAATTIPSFIQVVGQVTGGASGGLITPRFGPEAAAATTLQCGSWALIL